MQQVIEPLHAGIGDLSSLVEQVKPEVRYLFEPVGSGRAYLHLLGRGVIIQHAMLCASDRHLIELYEEVKRDPKDLHTRLTELYATYEQRPRETFETIQAYWNQRKFSSAKYLFLLLASGKLAGADDKHQASWGGANKLDLPTPERLQTLSQSVQKADFDYGDPVELLQYYTFLAEPGTVAYVDVGGYESYLQAIVDASMPWAEKDARVVFSSEEAQQKLAQRVQKEATP